MAHKKPAVDPTRSRVEVVRIAKLLHKCRKKKNPLAPMLGARGLVFGLGFVCLSVGGREDEVVENADFSILVKVGRTGSVGSASFD